MPVMMRLILPPRFVLKGISVYACDSRVKIVLAHYCRCRGTGHCSSVASLHIHLSSFAFHECAGAFADKCKLCSKAAIDTGIRSKPHRLCLAVVVMVHWWDWSRDLVSRCSGRAFLWLYPIMQNPLTQHLYTGKSDIELHLVGCAEFLVVFKTQTVAYSRTPFIGATRTGGY